MRLVPINCAKEGYFLGKTLYNPNGRILLREGTALNDQLINSIRISGIQTVYINDEYSDNEIDDIIKPEIRMKAVSTIKNTFTDLQKQSRKNRTDRGGFKGRNAATIDDNSMKSLEEVSKAIVDDVLASRNTMICLVDIKSMDNYTYEHSVSVAVLSLILGIELGLNAKQLDELCIGALLHDIGKAFIPAELLLKPEKLTDEEFSIIKEHPVRGYEYVKDNLNVPSAAKVAVLQHHEKTDGSGYPRGIDGSQIHNFAKIIAITDVYDALTSDRPYRQAASPNEALELIMGSAGRHFDFSIAQTFVRKVTPYPVGTLVRLSNGDVGVVEEVRSNFPLRPKVKVIKQDAVNVVINNIDLLTENSLVIEGIQYEAPNISVPAYLKRT